MMEWAVNRTILACAAALAFACSGNALASNWVEVGTSTSGTIYFVDSDNIRSTSSNVVEFWEKLDYTHDKTIKYRTISIF